MFFIEKRNGTNASLCPQSEQNNQTQQSFMARINGCAFVQVDIRESPPCYPSSENLDPDFSCIVQEVMQQQTASDQRNETLAVRLENYRAETVSKFACLHSVLDASETAALQQFDWRAKCLLKQAEMDSETFHISARQTIASLNAGAVIHRAKETQKHYVDVITCEVLNNKLMSSLVANCWSIVDHKHAQDFHAFQAESIKGLIGVVEKMADMLRGTPACTRQLEYAIREHESQAVMEQKKQQLHGDRLKISGNHICTFPMAKTEIPLEIQLVIVSRDGTVMAVVPEFVEPNISLYTLAWQNTVPFWNGDIQPHCFRAMCFEPVYNNIVVVEYGRCREFSCNGKLLRVFLKQCGSSHNDVTVVAASADVLVTLEFDTITVYDYLSGAIVRSFDVQFKSIRTTMSLSPDGLTLCLFGPRNDHVSLYALTGELTREIQFSPTTLYPLVCFTEFGDIAVSTGTEIVTVCSETGKVQSRFGSSGNGVGQFQNVNSIAAVRTQLYVFDWRGQVFE